MLWIFSILMKKLFELVFKMTFTSPHFSLLFLLLLDFFFLQKKKKKKGTKLYLNTSKSFTCPIERSLSPLLRALPLISKPFFFFFPNGPCPQFKGSGHFFYYSQMGFALSSKDLVSWFKKISSFNPHWAFGEPTHVFGFQGFKTFPKHGRVRHLFNKAYNIHMILGSLAFEKYF